MEHVIWVEKYRPKKISECILPKHLKSIFQGIVDNKVVPNMILSGSSGLGKTTVARAICEELGIDYIMINASDARGISFVRDDIPKYASSMAFQGGRKVMLFDEADNFTGDAQALLRGRIEEFSKNCSFVFTVNHPDKIIPAIQSRCGIKEFRIPKEEKQEIYKQLFERICYILENESIKYDKKVVTQLIGKYFPDYRRIIQEIQIYSNDNGELNAGILTANSDLDLIRLYKILKDRKYNDLCEWVAANSDIDYIASYTKIYKTMKTYMKPQSIPIAVEHLSDHQYMASFSANQEICFHSFLGKIMRDCEWI